MYFKQKQRIEALTKKKKRALTEYVHSLEWGLYIYINVWTFSFC